MLGLAAFQAPDAQAQTITPETTARGVTVMSRLRPDYDPAGVRLSGFRLDAALDSGIGYDDNLLPGRNTKRSGAFAEEALTVTAGSDWTRHAVGVVATQATRQHFEYSDLNWNDYSVGLFGRYDIGRASSVRARYDRIRSHIDVDNFDNQQEGSLVPIPLDTDIFQVAGTAVLNRVRLGATLDYRMLRYQDVTTNGVRDVVSTNDYNTVLGEFTADYSFLPDRYVVTLVRLQDIAYQNCGGFCGRDSFTWEAQTGVQYDFTGLWQARILVGYRERNYEQPGQKSLTGPAFEGRITYLPSQLTTVSLIAQRTIEESIRESNVSYTRTAARLRVDHELLRNIIVSGEVRGEQREYPQGVGTVSDAIALLEARVLLNRNVTVTASYQYTERLEAPTSIQEYGRNQMLLRLRLSL